MTNSMELTASEAIMGSSDGYNGALASELETAIYSNTDVRQKVDYVLFLCPAYDSRYPSETMWQRLKALTGLGKILILPLKPSPAGYLEPANGATVVQPVTPDRMKANFIGYPSRIKRIACGLRERGGSGIIWSNSNLFTRMAARSAARLTGWPLVMDVWDVPDLPVWSQSREGRYLKSWAHRVMQSGLAGHLQAADLVVWSLHPDSAHRYFSVDKESFFHLPNGLIWNDVRGHIQATDPSGQTGSGRGLKLLYMGHFRNSRGSSLLVETVLRLRRTTDIELNIVGPISSPSARKAVERIPAAAKPFIRFHGHLPWASAMKVLSGCDICLYPFPHGPDLEHIYPLKLLEYAAMNKWTISSDLAGARRLLSGYEKVRYLDPSQPEQWVSAVEELAAMPADEFKLCCNNSAIAGYDWELINRKLLGRIGALLESSVRLH